MTSLPASLPVSVATLDRHDADVLATAHTVATELARLLPSTATLEVAVHEPANGPAPSAPAVRASFVGGTSAELVVVADAAVADALAGAGAGVSLADALRPALEGAVAVLGPGVLEQATTGPLGSDLDDDGLVVFALSGPTGPQAWCGIRLRPTGAGASASSVHAPQVPQQRGSTPAPRDREATMRLLQHVEMTLTAEIGRTRLPVRQVLELVPGTVLELDREAGAPADVMVNGRLVARGEVVVVDEHYGIRVTEIVSTEQGA
ncbi:flagellar motor switch protein FliN [Actinotalea ferrariae]|uniref:flagellar motor switch protein FliN n=1 Tax=Actinotalea ferrariae TaxID=1386098 RepID=UPI001C8B0A7A|nr:flagellar motor switch protein FliN [Actinotalea ferrariae]MBX9245167.1 flagellar motor switch protein FliN [Actinotalea ferrariae]